MLGTTFLTLVLASFATATPSSSDQKLKLTSCDSSHATIAFPPGQTTLAVPTATPSYVAVALGTQNYTCSSTGIYTNVGALAELFDISCLYNTSAFENITDLTYSLWKLAPPSLTPQSIITLLHSTNTPNILGQHYYVTNPTGTGVSPKWDFTSQGTTKGNPNAYVIAAKVASLVAPTGPQDIDWVQLQGVSGSLATAVYRTDTRGGQPSASCTPGTADITVKYTSKYWLLGSSL